MWTTGARIIEALGLTRSGFIDDGYDFGVMLKKLKQRAGRPSNASLVRSRKRYVPIADPLVKGRIQMFIQNW